MGLWDGTECGAATSSSDWAVRAAGSTTIAAGGSGQLSWNGGEISITTTVANETVRAWCWVRRDNTAAGGTGTYEFTVGGTVQGPAARGMADVEDTVSFFYLLTVSTPGTYAVGVKLTAATGNESVDSGALMVEGANVS